MRDVDDGHASCTKPADDSEHLRRFGVGQCCRRLVKDEQSRLLRQDSRECGHRPLDRRQAFHVPRDVDRLAETGECRRCRPVQVTPPHDTPAGRRRSAQEHVLRDREAGDRGQLLEQGRHADRHRPPGGTRSAVSVPSTVTRPESGVTTPAMILISVDLPAPFSPRSAWTSPAATSRWTSSSTTASPYVLRTPSTDRMLGTRGMLEGLHIGCPSLPHSPSRRSAADDE